MKGGADESDQLGPQSKFEWRREDITILTEKEAAEAEAEYLELLAELEVESEKERFGLASDDA